MTSFVYSLRWRHNGHDGVSNHQHNDRLLNRLFRRRSKKISKPCVTGICERNSPVSGEFPTQRSHSVESPSMVDPQWNIWYWGSKWNLRTVCSGAVGCEWGTASVYFGITYVCFISSGLPVFAVEPQYRHQYYLIFVKSMIWKTHTKSLKKSCWFKL